jgi:predicted nucleic acid-binding protein
VSFLVDTNVISELASKHPNPAVSRWIDSIEADRIYLSVVTIGEIEKGIERLRASRRREALSSWLEKELLVRFRDRLLPLDVSIVRQWGRLNAVLEKQGAPMPAVDSLLAATALHHGLTMVTRNVSDFERSGVEILDPWHFTA